MITSSNIVKMQVCGGEGEGRCTKFNKRQHCLNSGPDYVYTMGMIYVSWTNSRPDSDVAQMRDLCNFTWARPLSGRRMAVTVMQRKGA